MANKRSKRRYDDEDFMADDMLDELDDDFSDGNKKGWVPVVMAIFLIFIIAGIAVGMKLYEKYSYSKEEMDLVTYYGIEQDWQTPLIVQDEVIEDWAVYREGNFYLPLTFVQKNLNDKFYYDRSEHLLLYTTPTDLYEIPLNSTSYTVSQVGADYGKVIWILQDEVPYVEIDFVAQYSDFLCQIYTEPNRIQLYVKAQTSQISSVNKDTAVRYQGGIKSDILKPLEKGEKVYVLEQMETWAKVKTENSIIGYVENKRLNEISEEQIALPGNYVAPVYSSIQKPYPINMAWHQVTNSVANEGVDSLLANTKGINTISPTWFFLSDNMGNFTSIADQSYVDKMHARGIEVWALIDNFTYDVDIQEILSTTTNRKYLIDNLVQTVLAYDIDGINVDFEQVPIEAGEDYVQFVRELSIPCRANGIVLSVDNYVPSDFTAHYGRAQQGEVVDYVVIMGYDEHYGGSPQAGSVASIGYVKAGIEDTIKEVPAEKVINGIPFYARLWRIADEVTSDALSMSAVENQLAQHGVTPTWDAETAQNFAEFEADGAKYQVWMEDLDSISAKLNLMSNYNLAGVAQWKLGLEKPQVWDLILDYLSKSPRNGQQDSSAQLQIIETD